MVILGDKSKLSAETVRSVEPWAKCVSGALEKQEYEALLREQASRTSPSRSHAHVRCGGDGAWVRLLRRVGLLWRRRGAPRGALASAFIRARKLDQG